MTPINAKHRREITQLDISAPIIGFLGKSIRDCPFSIRTQPTGVSVVGVVKDRPVRLVDEPSKYFLNRREIGVEIKMLFFNIQNQSMLRMKIRKGPVALIPFGDKIFAAGIPMRI